jgi:hypothetical protein
MPPPLKEIIARLHDHYGPPEPPPSDDPFELILWEQAAYLADDERHAATLELLALRVGLTLEKILAAEDAALIEVARHGGSIAVAERAARLRESARLVLEN